MERFDIKMFTSAWGRRYNETTRGSWIPFMGKWTSESGWEPSRITLHVGGTLINPAPLILVVGDRIRDIDLEVKVTYKTAKLKEFEEEISSGRRFKYPIYEHDQQKEYTLTIPRFTDVESVFRIAPDDALIYEIVNVEVLSEYRISEGFVVYALASPSARIIFGQHWYELYENIVAIRKGIFAAPTPCVTCRGTGLLEGITCPECKGWSFSGSQATGFLLEKSGEFHGVTIQDGEDEEHFRKRIWARKWIVSPTKEEIRRYFEHFCHVSGDALLIFERFSEQEPTFFVAVDPSLMGEGALWQIGDQYENYDGLVERITPAGVNGYFSWLLLYLEQVDTASEWTDASSEQLWSLVRDVYGNVFNGSIFHECNFGGFEDAITPCSGVYSAWDNFKAGISGWSGIGSVSYLSSFKSHNHLMQVNKNASNVRYSKSHSSVTGTYTLHAWICLLDDLPEGKFAGVLEVSSAGDRSGIGFYTSGGNLYIAHRGIFNLVTTTRTVITAEKLKWYHFSLIGNQGAATVDVYVDSIYQTTFSGVNLSSGITDVEVSTDSGSNAAWLVDAIDGIWDTNSFYQVISTKIKTRNMFQESHAVKFQPGLYGGVNPVEQAPVDHWIQGYHSIVHSNWLASYNGHEAVMLNPNFAFPLGILPARLEYWYYDAKWIHRVVNAGENLLVVYDDHKLVSVTQTASTTYTINHSHVSGIVLNTFDFINAHGGVEFVSTRPKRKKPSQWELRGIYIGQVDEWKGVLLPTIIASRGILPQYIIDTETIGNIDSTWECYLYLDPHDNSEFDIEFHSASGIAFPIRFNRGNILDYLGNRIGYFGERKWTHLQIEWDLGAFTYDITVDEVLIASGTPFQNNYSPFTFLRIGWLIPGSIVKGDVAYISGINAAELTPVDESVTEGYESYGGKDVFNIESAISQTLSTFSFYDNPDGHRKSWYKHYLREDAAMMSLVAVEGENKHIAWVGDKIMSFNKECRLIRKATNNFYLDDIGSHPRKFLVQEPSNTLVEVIDKHYGHAKPLRMYDNNNGQECYIVDYFGYRQDGEVEFFMMNDSLTKAFYIDFLDSLNVIAFRFYMRTPGNFVYNAASNFDGTPSYDINKWYHVRIRFDVGSQVANVWLNGLQLTVGASPDIPFWNFVNEIHGIRPGTHTTDYDYTVHLDALAYSWDPRYVMGQNKNIGCVRCPSRAYLPSRRENNNGDIFWSDSPLDFINLPNKKAKHYREGNYRKWSTWSFAGSGVFVEEKDGHHFVFNLLATTVATKIFDVPQATGTIDLWVQEDFTIQTDGPFMRSDPSGILQYYTGTWNNFKDYQGNNVDISGKGWVHVSIDFGSPVYKYQVQVEGEYLRDVSNSTIDIQYISSVTTIPDIEIKSFSGDIGWIDAVGFSWESYDKRGNAFPHAVGRERMLAIKNSSIRVDGKGFYFPFNDKKRIMIVSKGLNRLLTS